MEKDQLALSCHVLPEKTISMLDEICIKTDRRKNEVIIRLIQAEYEQIKKGGH